MIIIIIIIILEWVPPIQEIHEKIVWKYAMDKSIKECVPKTQMAKDFLEYVKANYTKIDKEKMTTYLKLLITTMYDGVGGVREIGRAHVWTPVT